MLGNMKHLEVITIFDSITPIRLTSFVKFKSLKSLTLSGGHIEFLDLITNFKKLENLSISNSMVSNTNWKLLDKENNIEIFKLQINEIKNIDFLSSWKNLKSLDLSKNEIKDLSPISILKSLETISLKNVSVKNIKTLYTLCQNGRLGTIILSYETITDEILEALKLIEKEIYSLVFYGITLYRNKNQIENLLKKQTLVISSINKNTFLRASIDHLRLITSKYIKDIQIPDIDKNIKLDISSWRTNWKVSLSSLKHPNFSTLNDITPLKKYHFEELHFSRVILKKITDLTDFDFNFLAISYVPTEEELRKLFYDHTKVISFFDYPNDINLINLKSSKPSSIFIESYPNTKVHFNLNLLKANGIGFFSFKTIDFTSLLCEQNKLPLMIVDTQDFINTDLYLKQFYSKDINNIHNARSHFMPLRLIIRQSPNFNKFLHLLKDVCNMDYLELSNNNINDTRFLSNIERLKMQPNSFYNKASICLDNNPISDIVSLEGYYLSYLGLNNCKIEKLPLFEEISINKLSLQNNPLKDIKGLTTIRELEHLELSGSCFHIKDFKHLKELNSLQHISITVQEKQLQDIVSALKQIKSLEQVRISYSIETNHENCQVILRPIEHLIIN
jgi:hypothetical protein